MPMQPYRMNDDDYQAESDMHTLKAAREMTPEREAKARAMAAQKAREMAEMAQGESPRKKEDVMTKGYRVVKG